MKALILHHYYNPDFLSGFYKAFSYVPTGIQCVISASLRLLGLSLIFIKMPGEDILLQLVRKGA